MLSIRGRWFGGALLLLVVGACSKTNNVSQDTTLGIGQQCDGPQDKGCGVGAVCVLGVCRAGCSTDLECPQGAICVGDQAPFGCSLPSELACSSSLPCASEALKCGLDHVCRLPCQAVQDCSRNEHECIAGTCVGKNEREYQSWLMCSMGDNSVDRCDGASYQKCNVLGVGWKEASSCGSGACTLPGGSCIDPIVAVQGDLEKSDFALFEDKLYWFNEGTILSSPTEPGSSTTVVMELPVNNPDFVALSGPLLGVIGNEFANMYRIEDGVEVLSVPAEVGDMFPMPTSDGLYWLNNGTRELKFAAPEAAAGAVLGTVPAGRLAPSFCGDGAALYFIAQYDDFTGTLHRWTEEGIESLLPGASFVLCRKDDVLVTTAQGVISLKPDGSQDVLLAEAFDTLFVDGNDFIGGGLSGGASKSFLRVGNFVTGEIHGIYETGGPQSASFAADDTNIYFVAGIMTGGGTAGPPKYGPPYLMRGTWK